MASNDGLRRSIFENMKAILSSDTEVRRCAEMQMKVYEILNDYILHLTEILMDVNVQWPIRQLASLLLKRHIDIHWCSKAEKFEPPEVVREVKVHIKNILLNALGLPRLSNNDENFPEQKMRRAISFTISTIAHFDWPEEWPELFQVLLQYLNSHPGAVFGAMEVFAEICQEISEKQLPTMAPLLLPKMYEIFVDSQSFSLSTRCKAVQVFRTVAENITLIGDYDKNAIKQYLDPILPNFTEAFVKVLQVDSQSELTSTELKANALMTLTMLVKHCRKKLFNWMPQILTPVWLTLTRSAEIYVETVVNADDDGGHGGDNGDTNGCDFNQSNISACSDDNDDCLDELIFAIFEFIAVLIEPSKTRKLVKQGITDLLYYILKYMQITDDMIQVWTNNPDRFVEDEDEDSYTHSVRVSAQDILMSLSQEYLKNESAEDHIAFQMAVVEAFKKHLMESNQMRSAGNRSWWKIQEACLLTLGFLSPTLIETIEKPTSVTSTLANDIRNILDHLFSVGDDASPFFTGRTLMAAASYVTILNESTVDRLLQATINGLTNQSCIVKISALRATYTFCCTQGSRLSMIQPYLGRIFEACLSIGTQHTGEVLSLVFQTLNCLIQVDPRFGASVESKVSPLAISAFLMHAADPVVVTTTQDIFKELSRNELCSSVFQQRICPVLVSVLSPNQQSNNNIQTLQPVAMDILTTVVRNSSEPLSEQLTSCFPVAVKCILNAVDDTSTMQNGGECVRAFVSKGVQQLAQLRDHESGKNGMELVMSVCMHLLDPRANESCASFVGKLIFIAIIKGAPYLGNDNIHLLLRSVLSKLQSSQAQPTIQSLIMVFAHLINHDMNTVLDFLSSLPGPSGSMSALEFVLQLWLNRQPHFFGPYDSKVSIIALCKLLEHSLVNQGQDNRLNLNHIRVHGDRIMNGDHDYGVRTRSKAVNDEKWTFVPATVKILKLLLNELHCIDCYDNDDTESEYEDEDDDDDDDDDIRDRSFGGSSFEDSLRSSNRSASDLNSSGYMQSAQFNDVLDSIEADSEYEDDQDVINDPISKINLAAHLLNFVKNFSLSPFATEFNQHLNETEKRIFEKYCTKNNN